MKSEIKKRKQGIPGNQRYTVQDLFSEFPNDDACLEHIKEARWPNGVTLCEKCKVERKHHRVTGRTAYACNRCGNHIYPLAGSIFEKSTTSLQKWFYAMFLSGSTRCGISAKQLQREVGVTYKTAWRMFKQIRTLMSEDIRLEGSTVEMDEMYVGGKRRYGRGTSGGRPGPDRSNKTSVFGTVERGGRVVAKVTPDVKAKTIYPIVQEFVLPASVVYTDEYPVYDRLANAVNGYQHHRIRHAEKVLRHGRRTHQHHRGFLELGKARNRWRLPLCKQELSTRAIWMSTAFATTAAMLASRCSFRFWHRFRSRLSSSFE